MSYLSALLFSFSLGFLTIRRLHDTKLGTPLMMLLSAALGLGISGHLVFYTHILLNQHHSYMPLVFGLFLILWLLNSVDQEAEINEDVKQYTWGLVALAVVAVMLLIEAQAYPFGGWDAWSSWNLKAKFIFLGREQWNDVLDPVLWRSNTHYPLLLPSITVWFWDLLGAPDQWVPMINSVLWSVLTAGMLIFGLQALTGRTTAGVTLALAAGTVPLVMTLAVSQYSDIVFGVYFLAALLCFLLDLPVLALLFAGLLSFTKVEGTVASIILFALIVRHTPFPGPRLGHLFLGFLIAALPTILFLLFISPSNEAFVNGWTSVTKPTTFSRFIFVTVYPFLELISFKWNGLWLLAAGGIALGFKQAFRGKIKIIPQALGLYMAVVLAYYQINTFFDIGWWMDNTLSRILFALLPSVMLWVGMSLRKDA